MGNEQEFQKNFISINECRIESVRGTLLENVSWKMRSKEAWLVVGANGSGKANFLNALAGDGARFIPNKDGAFFSNAFENSAEIISLEKAAALIEEERANDESEYVEGGVDHGRTARVFLCEGILGKKIRRQTNGEFEIPETGARLENFPEVKLCGIENILDRGLKYLSTGEIRRTYLCRALLRKKQLLILSDPFAGLDAQSRKILLDFFDGIATRQLKNSGEESGAFPRIILSMERFNEIPESINCVLEFSKNAISFCGSRREYEEILSQRQKENSDFREKNKIEFKQTVQNLVAENFSDEKFSAEKILVEMRGVNVGWGEHRVLRDLSWTLRRGEHWLIRGPNGSGKTTFLELITGDNMQVFCNDVKIFGARRGSGETIWDIKKRLGIVSYRLHVEYRMVGQNLLGVIVSGFHDSIGLYEAASDVEIAAAKKWLALGGFSGRENEQFSNLSYGEQRAILILRASVKSPEILILDEPCHGLDENFRQKILNLLETIAESGTTTLLHVTHDPSEALACEKNILEFLPNENPMYKIIEL
ncbi:MAG: ATP-binding cassette domain-containing protein [Treponemataceae bacterium]|nr:ATP-binding cassette domain-containing protein [Treponemataceae bacterium]